MVLIQTDDQGMIIGAINANALQPGFSPVRFDGDINTLVGGMFIDGVLTPKPLPIVTPMTYEEKVDVLIDLVAEQSITIAMLMASVVGSE